jgi:Rrf2 family iron-sulfur cluster assembly transcriptional regulator
VAALVDLALQQSRRPTALADIARRQDISISYLEQLFARLRQAGLIRSVRGPGGGYVLARPTREISIGDICAAVTASDEAPAIPGSGPVQARTQALWQRVDDETARVLRGITLQEVLDSAEGSESEAAA